jgi:hypothetical protein
VDSQQLAYFRLVARLRHVTQAAEQLKDRYLSLAEREFRDFVLASAKRERSAAVTV